MGIHETTQLNEGLAPSPDTAAPSQLSFAWGDGESNPLEWVEIQSRRYLGSKSRLLPFLHRIVASQCEAYESFADLFAGTGVVAHSFNRPEIRVIANDYLLSNFISLSCFLGTTEFHPHEAASLIAYLNSLPADEENYTSEQFGDRYFSQPNARKIGSIRDEIDRLELPLPLRNLALTSLLYAMDRVAHTVGHYDAYRRREDSTPALSERDRPLRLQIPHVEPDHNSRNEIHHRDANELVREIEVDLIYLDPPYNSRQYSDSYHVLETIMQNDKPELIGKARKRPGRPSRSRYCGKDARSALEDLIQNANCRWILFSYNNMSDGDKRSNSILSDEEIITILGERGPVDVHTTAFNSFTAKRELIQGHEERVYVCKVQGSKFKVQSLGPASELSYGITRSNFSATTSTLNSEQGTLNSPEADL